MNTLQKTLNREGVNSMNIMFDTARVVSDLVSEKLTKGQIALIWEGLEFRRDTIQDPGPLQVFWLAGDEIWVYDDGKITTMLLPNEILQEA